MALPHRGCLTCRKRRIKCDVIEPICGRCQKADRVCLWDVNDRGGLHFKNENVFAGGQPRKPRRANQQPSSPTAAFSVAAPLSMPLEEQAFHYWAEDFVFRPDDLPEFGQDHPVYIILEWLKTQPDSSLHLALSAYSHAIFGRAKQVTKAIENAGTLYARSIVQTHQEMKHVSDETIDQLLLTIMLMSSFENTMYTKISSSNGPDQIGSRFWKTMCHHEGAIGLLKLRRQQAFTPNLRLDRAVRRQIIRTCILRGVIVPDFLQDGASYGEVEPALSFDSLMVLVASVRTKALCLFADNSHILPSWQYITNLLVEARQVDSNLDLWAQRLPEEWTFSVTQLSDASGLQENQHFYDDFAHSYTTHGHASIWNRYRAVRLIVNSICLRALSILPPQVLFGSDFSELRSSSQANTDSLTIDLCRSISFFFNTVNHAEGSLETKSIIVGSRIITSEREVFPKMAAFLAWPLTVAVSTESVAEPQRKWLNQKLKIVASSLSDAILESVSEQDVFRF